MNSEIKLSMADEEGYWISPEGDIYLLDKKHIDMVFDYPSRFGLNMKLVESVYDLYNEEYRTEGKARREILLMLFSSGWIRARRYHRPHRWSINVSVITEVSAGNIRNFASAMIEKGHPLNDEVILDTRDNSSIYTLGDLYERKTGSSFIYFS